MFTHIFISDKLGFHLLMQAIWVLSYGSTLESSTYSIHPEDYLFLFFFGTVLTTVISFILGPLLQIGYVTYTGSAMVMMLLYVWSKEFPHQVRFLLPHPSSRGTPLVCAWLCCHPVFLQYYAHLRSLPLYYAHLRSCSFDCKHLAVVVGLFVPQTC